MSEKAHGQESADRGYPWGSSEGMREQQNIAEH